MSSRRRAGGMAIWGLLAAFAWAVPALAAEPAPAADASSRDPNADKLNVNKANAKELQKLPGIGVKTAERILQHRKEKGPFASIEDLTQVPRIGKVTMGKIRPMVCVTGGSDTFDPLAFMDPIDVNNAEAKELMKLPGIGKKTAAAIITYRTEHGPFCKVEDLMNVPRIGQGTIDKIRKLVKIAPNACAGSAN